MRDGVRKALRTAGKVLAAALTALLALVLAANLYLIVARSVFGQSDPTVFGFTGAVVLTGSMAGTIEVNDMVVTRRQSAYDVGDVVTYRRAGARSTTTHRIVARTEDGFITRGDANNGDDAAIREQEIIGKVVAVIPKIGAVTAFLQFPAGVLALLLAGAALLERRAITDALRRLFGKGKKEE